MKRIATLLCVATALFSTASVQAQGDKSKRPSPPAELNASLSNGATVKINYSQPAVKGRTIGKDIAPYGEVWRTGANEATTIEFSKDVQLEGKPVKAGRYALFTIPGADQWTIILNTKADQWGAYDYKKDDDVLRVTVKPQKAAAFSERMTFTYNNNRVLLNWGDVSVPFTVK